MTTKILCVDDEPAVLTMLRQMLEPLYEVVTAENSQEGILALQHAGPFAVIISDHRMPGMSGAQFMAMAKMLAPTATRIMLTAYANLQLAIEAINEGAIFRFLHKPFDVRDVRSAVEAGMKEYHRLVAERELLDETLESSIRAFVEMLEMANPSAHAKSQRLTRTVTNMARLLALPCMEKYQLAAMLAHIGLIAVPQPLVEKHERGEHLTPDELDIFLTYPSVGFSILQRIPRLQEIAVMVAHQLQPAHFWRQHAGEFSEREVMGAQLLKVAIDYDQHQRHGHTPADTLAIFDTVPQIYDLKIVEALRLSVMQPPASGTVNHLF